MNTATPTRSAASNHILTLAVTALMTALLCVLAPFSIPVGPVPISLATLVIYLSVYLLGWKMSTVSVLLYLLMGLIGVPVFSGFSAGFAKLAGPTGGYLIGYVPLAAISGLLIELSFRRTFSHGNEGKFRSVVLPRVLQFAAIVLGTAVLYALGTAWFCIVMECDLPYAMGLCVLPFIPGDLIKAAIAVVLGPELRRRIPGLPIKNK